MKLRLQYAQTAVRPEIREVAPTAFADFTSGRTILGNPDLQKTRVIHYDTRADLYLPFQQTISVSLFYKDFTKPVETSVDIDKIESQQNAQGAYVKGVEFEAVINPGPQMELDSLVVDIPKTAVNKPAAIVSIAGADRK